MKLELDKVCPSLKRTKEKVGKREREIFPCSTPSPTPFQSAPSFYLYGGAWLEDYAPRLGYYTIQAHKLCLGQATCEFSSPNSNLGMRN